MDGDGGIGGDESSGGEEGAAASFGARSRCLGLVSQALHDRSELHEVARGDVGSRPQEMP
jgi:hypothetical protein